MCKQTLTNATGPDTICSSVASSLSRTSIAMVSHTRNHSGQEERQRQHRRQISTPSGLEAAKAPKLPTPAMQRHQAHRRGQSLDQRPILAKPTKSIPDETFPTTNASVYEQPQIRMREAQCQQFAQQRNYSVPQDSSSMPFMPQCQSLSQEELQALTNGIVNQNGPNVPYTSFNLAMLGNPGLEGQPTNVNLNHMVQRNSNPTIGGPVSRHTFNNVHWDASNQPEFATFQQTTGTQMGMRRPSVQSDSARSQPPHTPRKQGNTCESGNVPAKVERTLMQQAYCRPITPATTPFRRSADIATQKEGWSSPIKEQSVSVPVNSDLSDMQRARSLQGVTGTISTQPKIEMPSPPNTASFDFDHPDVFDCKQGSSFENPESQPASHHHYASSSASISSFYSTPELADMPSPVGSGEKAHKVPIYPATPNRQGLSKNPVESTPGTPGSKSSFSPRPTTIDNLNLDDRVHASIKQTGVTMDEISSYIFGPDPDDGKWMCLHPECGRRFGRKENIKSHVQTHLGDRQFKCEDCGKCFVRGHDLKRHAKIHTGDKPYECLCGNVFARHDALTRHRQRGMCIGGYQGVVRKTVKRGRPKKHRPEMDERQDKAARTRQRVAEKCTTESVSGSESSRNTPPSEVFETMSLYGQSPAPVQTNPNYSLPPEVFTYTPPVSPGNTTANRQSPNELRHSPTPSTEDEMLPLSPAQRLSKGTLAHPGLPMMPDADIHQFTDVTNSSTGNPLSSPHTAPALTDSTNDSDLDIFIDTSGALDHGVATFPDSFDDGMDLMPGKPFSIRPTLTDEMMRYPNDELPSDVMSKDLFLN